MLSCYVSTATTINVDEQTEKDYGIDRENPLYLRDHFDAFRNEGKTGSTIVFGDLL